MVINQKASELETTYVRKYKTRLDLTKNMFMCHYWAERQQKRWRKYFEIVHLAFILSLERLTIHAFFIAINFESNIVQRGSIVWKKTYPSQWLIL